MRRSAIVKNEKEKDKQDDKNKMEEDEEKRVRKGNGIHGEEVKGVNEV